MATTDELAAVLVEQRDRLQELNELLKKVEALLLEALDRVRAEQEGAT